MGSMRQLVGIIALIFCVFGRAQAQYPDEVQAAVDSLKLVVRDAKHDTVRYKAYDEWALQLRRHDRSEVERLAILMEELADAKLKEDLPEAERTFFQKAHAAVYYKLGGLNAQLGKMRIAGEYYRGAVLKYDALGNRRMKAGTLVNLANTYLGIDDYDEALKCYEEAITICVGIDEKKFHANALIGVALIQRSRGNLREAIDINHQALIIQEELYEGPHRNIGAVIHNIGSIYKELGDDVNAMRKYREALAIFREVDFKIFIRNALSNIGSIYLGRGDYSRAEQYFYEALELSEFLQDEENIGSVINSLGQVQQARGRLDTAMILFEESLGYAEKTKSKSLRSVNLVSMAEIHQERGKVDEAMTLSLEAMDLAKEIGETENILSASKVLYQAYKAKGDLKRALEIYEVYVAKQDSMQNQVISQGISDQEYAFVKAKMAAADSLERLHADRIKSIELAKQEAELDNERTEKYALYGGLGLIAVLALVIYRSFLQKRKDNAVIRQKKQDIEEQQKQIVDSINYAQRIQESILPDNAVIQKYFPGFEAFYQPRDIVSGDFYWFAHLNGCSYLAMSDCTGHGVPGAFMSMIGSTLLKDIIVGSRVSNPSEVLEQLDDRVRDLLKQHSEEASEDGMEIALVRIDHAQNKLTFSGASQSLFLVNGKVDIVRGDLRGIGGWVRKRSRLPNFTDKDIDLNEVDAFYLSSDGLEDQFGGPDNKKYSRQQFVDLLHANSSKNAIDSIQTSFANWKGDRSQLDDVCVIGIDLRAGGKVDL